MKTLSPTRSATRLLFGFRLVSALAVVLVAQASGLNAASKKEKKDEAPQLISRTGGGGATWSNLAELEAAAKTENPKAWAQLGEIRIKGEQSAKNVPEGLHLLEKAAKAGEAPAAFNLGKVYDEGVLAPVDKLKAMDYFRAAAAGNVPEAYFNLGATYASGRGVKRDYVEGLAWLILAKKAGIENDGEARLRARMVAMRRPDLITKAENRAVAIAAELAEKQVVGLLPGAVPVKATRATRITPPPPTVPAPIEKVQLGGGQNPGRVTPLPPPVGLRPLAP